MKNAASILMISILAGVCSLQAEQLPKRKAGLWEIKTSVAGINRPMPAASHCIDAATDEELQHMAQGVRGTKCSKNEVKQNGNTYTIDSVCDIGTSTVTSHGTITGDFSSSYTGTFKSSFEPPQRGRKESEITLQATYLGDCKADQKPGDIVMPNGVKINLAQINAAAQASSKAMQ